MHKLIENSENKILLYCLNTTTNVPYCDSFAVEEEWLIQSLPGTKCCILRISYCLRWYKSTMMKGMIKSNTDTEFEKFSTALKQWIIDNGH